MKILCWNIVSLRAILKKNDINIICLQEIKLCSKTIDILLNILPEYPYKYYNIPKTKKGYSGVAIISKYKPESWSVKFDDDLGRYLKLKFKKFYLINLYAVNAGSKLEKLNKKQIFNNIFYNKIKHLKEKKEVIIVGDFNAIELEIDSYDFKKHHNKLAGITDIEINDFNKLLDLELYNVFRELYPNKIQYSYFTYRWPSRFHNKGILIDHAIVTKKILRKYIIDLYFLNNIYGSDHVPFILELNDSLLK